MNNLEWEYSNQLIWPLELANRLITHPVGIAEDVFVCVNTFIFPADFVVGDYEADPRVPLILGRPFLRTAKALVDHYENSLTLRIDNEKMIFHTDSSKHKKHSVKSIDIIDFSSNGHSSVFPKSKEPSSGSTTSNVDFLLEDFSDELAHIDPLPPGSDDDTFDFGAGLKEIESLLYHDPSLDPNSDLSDSQSDDDLFAFEANQDGWKNLWYGESCDDKTFDDEKPKMENVTDEPSIVSDDFSLLEGDSLSPSESSIEHHFFVWKQSIQSRNTGWCKNSFYNENDSR